MKSYYLLPILLISLTGCFKTAEEIKREETINKMLADLTTKVQGVQQKLSMTTGQIEENDFQRKSEQENNQMTIQQTLQQLTMQVQVLSSKVDQNSKKISSFSKMMRKQSKYIKKVNSTLRGVSTSSLKKGHKLFEKNKLRAAKEAYLDSLNEGISASQRNHVYYNLGLIDYRAKKYNKALVYFSKIYTKYPKSSWAPKALLFIGHSFNKLGKKDEANATYAEVISNYPKKPEAKKAKKELR